MGPIVAHHRKVFTKELLIISFKHLTPIQIYVNIHFINFIMRLCSWRWQMAACNRCCASFSECWCGFCSDVGVSRRLVGLGSSPPHPPFVFRRNGRALDAAGGLENLLYFDANPSKVSLGIFGWFGGNFVQRPERHYQAGQTWLAREKSREAESDCAKSFSEVKT